MSSRDELLARLLALAAKADDDPEHAHIDADDLLLEYIGDLEITQAFHSIEKWYA